MKNQQIIYEKEISDFSSVPAYDGDCRTEVDKCVCPLRFYQVATRPG